MPRSRYDLTEKQQEVIDLINKGYVYPGSVARELGVSDSAVIQRYEHATNKIKRKEYDRLHSSL
jgi:FixJ family two-component response regulator